MGEDLQRKFWQTPWGYRESIIVVTGVLLIGTILQMVVGPFNFFLLASPINWILAGVILFLCVLMGLRPHKSSFVRWFSGAPFSVVIILALLFLTIIMGLVPQITGAHHSHHFLGWDAMTSSQPFVLVYLITLLSLGTLLVRRLSHFRWSDYAFHLNHIGLWLLLLAAGLGYADIERYVMHVLEGETEWRVYDDGNNMKELPIAIELKDFDMDVYPPKLAIIDRETGDVQPLGKPQYFSLDAKEVHGTLAGWSIDVKQYIHNAVRSSDSTYREVPMPGATPAVEISATKDGVTRNGWVCGGNQAQIYMSLPLNDQYSVVMTSPEPRSFTSEIVVYTEDGEEIEKTLAVNHPLRVGNWSIYQHGYDNQAGRLSSYSSFELVYDPWLVPVYVGILMMMAGSVCLLWSGRNRKEKIHDME